MDKVKVKTWPTPAARDYKGANSEKHCKVTGTGRKHMDQLPNAVAHGGTKTRQTWQTPSVEDAGRTGSKEAWLQWENEGRTTQCRLRNQIWASPTQRKWSTPTQSDGMGGPGNSGREGGENLRTQTGGQLNPSWVETLMAWPKDWTCLDPMNLADYKKWLRGFVYEKAQNEKETLRGVREADGKAAVWGAPRGSWGMEPQEVLQSLMCEHSKVYNEIGLALAGAEVSERAMRVLRDTAAATGSPLGRELQEYSDNELADFVRVVSQVYPSYGRQAWASGTWEATHPRVATGIAHRVDRLKAIGNGQVPAVAALAWQILGGPVETEAAPSEPGAASNETSADIAPASRNKDSRRLK